MFSNFYRKSCRLRENVEEFVGASGATDYNTCIRWRMRFACWVSTATRAHAPAHANALANPHTHTHLHTRIYTRTNTDTGQYAILFAFPTATMAPLTRLNAPLYEHCFDCYISLYIILQHVFCDNISVFHIAL